MGDLVSGTSKHRNNIKNRVAKGVGILNEIFYILDNVSFGQFFFKTAMILRDALLINACLYNSDIWYNVTKQDINELDYLDKLFFSRLFRVPKSAPFESFFLENGVLNFEAIIKSRRILYFHNLLTRKKTQMIYSFVMTQIAKPTKNDWVLQVFDDLKDLNIDCSILYIQSLSNNAMKRIVKIKAKE